jgi:molecular chaperone HtpG
VTPNLATTDLYKFLKKLDGPLAERVVLVRSEVAKWLPLIVQVFPHYPSHGVDHSDRIIRQLSNMLFRAGKPKVQFSAAEVYCLLCSAYLHDAGMVVPPRDVENILSSSEWANFIGEEGRGHGPYLTYQKLRDEAVRKQSDRDSFIADSALRLLLAEFVRRDHHYRGKTAVELHPFLKALVDHGDALAFNTIADIGVAHGLNEAELSDNTRFPERQSVLGHEVNVRFLARLLRIGDLLDMDTDRADPMTEKGIAPLPASAEPHWQQYSTKAHELIAPDSIQFRFECRDQETHRVLRDWLIG